MKHTSLNQMNSKIETIKSAFQIVTWPGVTWPGVTYSGVTSTNTSL